jgi:hypothetical protein
MVASACVEATLNPKISGGQSSKYSYIRDKNFYPEIPKIGTSG